MYVLVAVSAKMAEPPIASVSRSSGPKPTACQPISAWFEVLLRSSVSWVLLVKASVAEPTPKVFPVEGDRPVFCPPTGCTAEKTADRLVSRLVKVALVSAAPFAKLTVPL